MGGRVMKKEELGGEWEGWGKGHGRGRGEDGGRGVLKCTALLT